MTSNGKSDEGLTMAQYHFSATGISNYLYDYFHHAWKLSGDERLARSVCNALCYYVDTNRAPIGFIMAMLKSNPKHVAKISLKGGSDEEILNRIKRYMKRFA